MREKTFRLLAPTGCDECNSESRRYPVKDGVVDVPAEMVEPLTRVAGFVLIGPTPDPEPVITPPSAEFIAEVDAAMATIAPGADIADPSPELVAEIIAAIGSTPHAAPAIPTLVFPT